MDVAAWSDLRLSETDGPDTGDTPEFTAGVPPELLNHNMKEVLNGLDFINTKLCFVVFKRDIKNLKYV